MRNRKDLIKLIFLLIAFTILISEVYLTISSPIAFGDEGFHVSLARYLAEKKEFPNFLPFPSTNIQKENYSRPQLWNFLESGFYFFSFNPIIIKVLIPLIAFLSSLALFSLTKKIWNERVAFFASIITLTTPSFVTYSLLFYTTLPFVYFFIISFFSFLAWLRTGEKKFIYVASVFGAIAFLTNLQAVFLLIFYLIFSFLEIINKNFVSKIKTYLPFLAIIFLITLPYFFRNLILYSKPNCGLLDSLLGKCFESYYEPKYSFEARTELVSTEQGVLLFGIINYLEFAYGSIYFLPLTFISGLFLSFFIKDRVNLALIIFFLVLIFAFIFIGGLTEGRAEDTARYFLSSVPILATFSSIYFNKILEIFEKEIHRKVIYVLIIIFVLIFSFINFYSKWDIMIKVKKFSSLFFEGCEWVKENLPKNATLFSLHTYPTIYNCERNAIWEIGDKADILLSNNLTLIKERFKLHGIDYVFVQKFSLSNRALAQAYPISFIEILENSKNDFEKIYFNGMEMSQCIRNLGCDGVALYRVIE